MQENKNNKIQIAISQFLGDKYLADVPCRKKTDDVVDALCLAVTGMIGNENGFVTIPEPPRLIFWITDADDLPDCLIEGRWRPCGRHNSDRLVKEKRPNAFTGLSS